MKTSRSIFVLLLLLVSAWSLMAANPADPPATVQTSLTPDGAPKAVRAPAHLTPMMAEIQAALEANREAVAYLAARFRAAADETEAMELAREIRSIKLEGRLGVLRIQLRYAQEEGRTEAAAELESAIERMTAPPRTGTPIPRPAPQRPAGQ
jgi:hypothetical protein